MPDATKVQAVIHCEVDARCIEIASRDLLCSRWPMNGACKQEFAVQQMPNASRVQTRIRCAVEIRGIECKQEFAVQ